MDQNWMGTRVQYRTLLKLRQDTNSTNQLYV